MYRLLTERKNVSEIRKLLGRLRLDYSIFFGVGGYHLSPEKTMAIELDMITYQTARDAAMEIGLLNRQRAVLLQEVPVVSDLIEMPHTVIDEPPLKRAWSECAILIRSICRSMLGL